MPSMPLIIKDFTWKQTEKTIVLRLPLKGIHPSKVDVFTCSNFIKAHFQPYFFEVFLRYDIDAETSKCVLNDSEAVFELVKKEERLWESLELDIDKSEKNRLRGEILEKKQEEERDRCEKRAKRKQELERYSVQEAMKEDSKMHEMIEKRKNLIRDTAMGDLEEWRLDKRIKVQEICDDDSKCVDLPQSGPKPCKSDELQQDISVKIQEIYDDDSKSDDLPKGAPKPCQSDDWRLDKTVKIQEICDDDSKNVDLPKSDPKPRKLDDWRLDKGVKIQEIYDDDSKTDDLQKSVLKPCKSEYVQTKKKEIESRVFPEIRKTTSLSLSFTERAFPTPSRESVALEEEEWLKNMNAAKRATGFHSADLRPEEHDPQWCKDKGDVFFKQGNFLGAISAYSHGINLSDKMPGLFSNRAAAHFAMGNFQKCVVDSSDAFDLLKPPCEANLQARVKCIVRRAAALCRMGMLNKAINEMKIASKLKPTDEKIKQDLWDMERAWEQDPDSE